MIEGTRIKQMESRLDVIEAGLRPNHEQVDERLETMEMGVRNTQEDASRIPTGRIRDGNEFARDFSHLREEFLGLSQQLSVELAIFSKQLNASLLVDFPPRATEASIIPRARGRQEREERIEYVAETALQGTMVNQANTLMPKQEIPVFERPGGGSKDVNISSITTGWQRRTK